MVVAMTSWGKRDLLERYGLPDDKVGVVPGARSSGSIRSPRRRTSTGCGRALPAGRLLLYPAQTWPHKNHETLLEALALIRRREGLAVPLVCPGKRNRHFADPIGELDLSETALFPGFHPLELRGLY